MDWQVLSQTAENIFLMRGCLQGRTGVSTSSSPPLPTYTSCGSKRRARRGMSSPRGLLTVFQTHFQSVVWARALTGSTEMRLLLNLQRTKEYIPHIPLGQAALHTGNTSLLYPCELTTNIILMSFLSHFKKALNLQVIHSSSSPYSGLSLSNLTKRWPGK